MSKPVIAVDFDDVIVPYAQAVVDAYNHEFNTHISLQYVYAEGIFDDPKFGYKHGPKEFGAWVDKYLVRPESIAVPPILGAPEAIERLAEEYEICIVTGRPIEIEYAMIDWLEKHMPGAIGRFYHTGFTSKLGVCREIGASWFIDDNPRWVVEVHEAGVSSILFGNYPWNRGKHPEGCWTAQDWTEVVEILNGRQPI